MYPSHPSLSSLSSALGRKPGQNMASPSTLTRRRSSASSPSRSPSCLFRRPVRPIDIINSTVSIPGVIEPHTEMTVSRTVESGMRQLDLPDTISLDLHPVCGHWDG
ncbi:hypothetical protein RSAG8_05361, partial [Rhizoctonia solani AG-8 WAC10335]